MMPVARSVGAEYSRWAAMFDLARVTKEGAAPIEPVEAGEIDIAAIHDVDGARLREQKVESVDVVQLAIRDVDEARDVAAQIQERVHLHRRLGRAEMRPREDRQAEVDGGRVE